jgi:hypothetical protein
MTRSQLRNLSSAQSLTDIEALNYLPLHNCEALSATSLVGSESPSLVLVINDTKLIMSCVKCFELGISNTCDEGVCVKEWWPQDHKEMVHGHKMTIMVEMHIK